MSPELKSDVGAGEQILGARPQSMRLVGSPIFPAKGRRMSIRDHSMSSSPRNGELTNESLLDAAVARIVRCIDRDLGNL